MLRRFSKKDSFIFVQDSEEYQKLLEKFEKLQDRVQNVVVLFSKHCQAISDVCRTSNELTTCLPNLYPKQGVNQTECDENNNEIESKVAEFREKVIAPLQTLLATFPKLKLRMDHRRGALETYQRYERKVSDLLRGNSNSARIQRNKLKLYASKERFEELDHEIQQEIQQILSHEVDTIFNTPFINLIQAQASWAEKIESTSMELKKLVLKEEREELAADVLPIIPPVKEEEESFLQQPETTQMITTGSISCERNPMVLDKRRSLRPKLKHTLGTRSHTLHHHMKDSTQSDYIRLPQGFELEEWVSVHVIDFFNEINLLFGTISELCTCVQMSAGPCYTYLWTTGEAGKSPISVSAFEYVEKLMTWTEQQINEVEKINLETSKTILKRMFRVYAHIYHSHLQHFIALKADSHLNFCFKRFIYFVLEFHLVDRKELNALKKLITALL